ncbi:hypothetical protein LOAG_06286 [Loa loa]|uniref:Uncharacterized protein n=1 Tax=Loa loa TaxID=7209 RepID=A0A1S0TZZ0_LOALO|nr:hypothetical protein LOAG_06286 [Loa loa]EFO22197.1 hypothetical protein LOAG_06286 [Loa loa]
MDRPSGPGFSFSFTTFLHCNDQPPSPSSLPSPSLPSPIPLHLINSITIITITFRLQSKMTQTNFAQYLIKVIQADQPILCHSLVLTGRHSSQPD